MRRLNPLLICFFCIVFCGVSLAQTVTRNLVVKYDFLHTSGDVISDMVRNPYGLDLRIPDTSKVEWLSPGLRVLSPVLVKTNQARSKLEAAPFFTDGTTIEAWLKPANNTQGGPARIITFSTDSGNRNFTLGQSATQYVMRFRTSDNPGNGTNPDTRTPIDYIDAVPTLQHVVYTRDTSGAAKLYVDRMLVTTEAIPGDGSNWDNTYDFGLFNETNYPTDDRTWLGDIFLVRIYSTVLTAAEVVQNFNAGPPKISTLVGTGEITLAWDANTEPDLAGYNIYYGKSSRDYIDVIDVAKVEWGADCTPYDPFKVECCEITLTGFTAGETYYFAATAYDDDENESGYSEELNHTFPPKETPTTPINLRERKAE